MSKPLRILVDGYNVLFQSGFVERGRSQGWLERARSRLLAAIQNAYPLVDLKSTEVVFDAAGRHRFAESEEAHAASQPLPLVTFASEHPEADDLIEERIRAHPHPKSLTIVSSDHRIQRVARARKAIILEADAFLDQLEDAKPAATDSNLPRSETHPTKPHKNGINDPNEVDYWLREFGQDDAS